MAEIQLGVIEARFADMIWEREPVTSSELVKLAEKAFSWKRTTTHTVLKRFTPYRAENLWRMLLTVRFLRL